MPDVKEQVNRLERALTDQELSFEHIDELENPMIVMGFGGEEFSFDELMVHIAFDLDGASAQIVTSPIANVSVEKAPRVLLALNECNSEYRWTRLYLDEDNDVIANGDVIFDEHNCADACLEIIMRTVQVIDEIYPKIMKAVWG